MYNSIIKPTMVFNTYVYFLYATLAFSTIFTTTRFLHLVFVFDTAILVASYFVIRMGTPADYHSTITVSLVDSGFVLFLIYIISIYTVRIFNANVEYAMTESEKNRRKSLFIEEELLGSSGKVVVETESIHSSMEKISENATAQAAAVEEISSAMEQLAAGINSVNVNASEQNQRTMMLGNNFERLSGKTEELNREISSTQVLARNISERAVSSEQSLKLMSDSMSRISASSREMTNIIAIINDISDQINLLSLNAAIEAARAGDAGRGFAVVADEISKLADRTSESIKAIDSLISGNDGEIQTGVTRIGDAVLQLRQIIKDIEGVNGRINAMKEIADDQVVINDEITKQAGEVQLHSTEINNSTREQTLSIDEMSRTVVQVNDMTQYTSVRIDEISIIAGSLKTMMSELNLRISGYKDEVEN